MILNEYMHNIKNELSEKINTLKNQSSASTTINSSRYHNKIIFSDLIGSPKKDEAIKFRSLSTSFNSITDNLNDEEQTNN